jgi:hypothetical protein
MTTHLTIVPDTKESRMARLQREWQALATQQDTRSVDSDVSRADVLAQAVADGLTQKEMAEGLQLSLPYINNLLRYHRFHSSIEDQKITESRFRQYWQQVRDPRAVVGRRKPEEKEAYEKIVFQAIAEMIQAGKPPLKPVKPVKRQTAEQLRANVEWAKAVEKEVRTIFETEMQPTLARLQGLLHADRATYSPPGLANAALVLERTTKQILQLLTKLKDDEMVSLTEEPRWHYTGNGARVAVIGTRSMHELAPNVERNPDPEYP